MEEALRVVAPVAEFKGAFSALSNFSYHSVFYDGLWYPTAEHAFQAAKSLSPDERLLIASVPTPKDAKGVGRKLFLRDDWEDIKYPVMRSILLWKFHWNPSARMVLESTKGASLTEGNYWHDNYWGECYCRKCENTYGLNTLGKLLMYVRDGL